MQQVDLFVPMDLPTMQMYVFVCGGLMPDQQVYSAPAKICHSIANPPVEVK